MEKYLKMLFTLLFVILMNTIYAQKKPQYEEQTQVEEAAKMALDNTIKSNNFKEWAVNHGMKGNYSFNITIGGKKGEVITIHATDRTGDVNQQNALKNYIKSLRFPFKMPKDQSYLFQYEFKF